MPSPSITPTGDRPFVARGLLRPQQLPLPPLQSTRLLDQLRERVRYLHYSRRTEDAYVHWCRAFIRFHGVRHPAEMGGAEVETYLTGVARRHDHHRMHTVLNGVGAITSAYRCALGRTSWPRVTDLNPEPRFRPRRGLEPQSEEPSAQIGARYTTAPGEALVT